MEFVLLVIAAAAVAGFVIYFRRRAAHAPPPAITSPGRRAFGGRRVSLPARESVQARTPPAAEKVSVAHAPRTVKKPKPPEKPKPPKLVFLKGSPWRPPQWPSWWPPPARRRQPDPNTEVEGRRDKARRELELRKLDVSIAKDFFLYEDVRWSETIRDQPSGIPKTEWDKWPPPLAERYRGEIPRYSYYESAFLKVTERLRGFHIYELYLEVLKESALEEDGSLEGRCRAALKAMERRKQKTNS